jgi:AraC-like DNA-binding protein
MPQLRSCLPSPELRPYVRAYAQRKLEPHDKLVVEAVPAQLEQILNFELGVMPGVRHRTDRISGAAWIGGAQTTFTGTMDLHPGVESFAIFFQPLGWSELFGVPAREITNHIFDATAVMGAGVLELWNVLVEPVSFEARVNAAEIFLRRRLIRPNAACRMMTTAKYIFRASGTIRISTLAQERSMCLRHFEREFQIAMGTSAKSFARVARFQAALDAKLAAPQRTWLDIAHYFSYHDQMHMVHDFRALGLYAPNQLIEQMGDVRPPALASA